MHTLDTKAFGTRQKVFDMISSSTSLWLPFTSLSRLKLSILVNILIMGDSGHSYSQTGVDGVANGGSNAAPNYDVNRYILRQATNAFDF